MWTERSLNNLTCTNSAVKNSSTFIILLAFSLSLHAQDADTLKAASKLKRKLNELPIAGKKKFKLNYNIFTSFYPIHESPTVGWRSKLKQDAAIVFDFHPVLTTSFYNNFKRKIEEEKLFGMGYYFSFRPHFRMYAKNSTPVQMPSYRIFLGLQHMYRLHNEHLVSYAIESGHYSNGQSGCAIGEGFDDQSTACDSLYTLITDDSNLSEMINRTNGDFSTNLSQFTINYRYLPDQLKTRNFRMIHSANFGVVYYHNNFLGLVDAGGHSANAIEMYGRWRFLLSYQYTHQWNSGYRFTVAEDIEIIEGAHPYVNPIRAVTTASFFLPGNLGIYISYSYGHDDYNLRFVDSGHQFGVGLVWDMFPPIEQTKNS